jgi:hypothetical protein
VRIALTAWWRWRAGPGPPAGCYLGAVGGEVGSLACSLRHAMALVPTDRLAETIWTLRILAGERSAWGIAAHQRCSNANSAVAPRRRSQPARIHLFSSSGSRRASTAGGRSARAPAAPPANDQPANSLGTRLGCRHGLEETSRMVGQRLQFWPLRGRCRPHHAGSKGAPA